MLGQNGQNPVQMVLSMMQGSDPQQVFNSMLNSNPQFKKFVDENKGLSPQQLCQKYGVDPSILNLMK